MNTDVYFPVQRPTKATKALWGAVTVLGISTLAMGAALVQVHMGHAEALAQGAGAPATQAPTTVAAPSKAKEHLRLASSSPKNATPHAQAGAKSAEVAGGAVPTASNSGLDPQGQSPLRKVANTSNPVCQTCGTVESVTPVQRESTPSGVGAVAGAVLGGIVGNQVGQGDGKTVATILGVLGGGWAGHTVEKKMKVETVYQVEVRMDDGTTRTMQQKTAPAVGSKVTVEGNAIGPAAVQTNSNSSGTAI